MKKVNLFIAMSLDGYIADSKGQIDWLEGHGTEEETIDVYSKFITGIDTVIMGWKTYDQIVRQLSPSFWPYEGLKTYVITYHKMPNQNEITFTSKDPVKLIDELSLEEGKDIWICGGASIIQQLIEKNKIDTYYITVIPVLLGSGIRLFDKTDQIIKLKLINTQSYNGMVDLVYKKR